MQNCVLKIKWKKTSFRNILQIIHRDKPSGLGLIIIIQKENHSSDFNLRIGICM